MVLRGLSIIVMVVALFLIALLAVPGHLFAAEPEPVIRVALLQAAPAVTFGVNGTFQIIDGATGKLIGVPAREETWGIEPSGAALRVFRNGTLVGEVGGPVSVRASGRVVVLQGAGPAQVQRPVQGAFVVGADGRVNPLPRERERVTVATATGTKALAVAGESGSLSVRVDGAWRNYRGDLEIRNQGGALLAVNELPLEDYLYGVVPAEMPYTWPQAALRAQAVAARTYALRHLQNPVHQHYHVCRSQSTQVYQGLDWERPSSNQAVDATRGQVLLYNGQPIAAIYHSSSGGYTENAEDVWSEPLPYIRGKVDPFDHNERHYGWRVSLTANQLVNQLAGRNYDFVRVTDVEVIQTTASGKRVQKLRITGIGLNHQPRTEIIANADRVRTALGLKSALFELHKETDPVTGNLARVDIVGHGWGHGLGMSQYGALGMAQMGFNHMQILNHYYTGVTLRPDYGC